MNHTGAAACYTCPQGYFCTSGSTADPCPQGYYCPIGTGTDKKPCPVGKCGGPICSCRTYKYGLKDICKIDIVEKVLSLLWLLSFKGTFGATDRLTNETECTPCTGGHYCDSQALTQPAGGCNAGYYCVSGTNNNYFVKRIVYNLVENWLSF